MGAGGRLVLLRHAFPRQPGRGVAGLLSPAFSFEPQLRRSALSRAVRAVRSPGAGSARSRQLSCVSGSPPSTAAPPGVPGEAALGCSASKSFLFFFPLRVFSNPECFSRFPLWLCIWACPRSLLSLRSGAHGTPHRSHLLQVIHQCKSWPPNIPSLFEFLSRQTDIPSIRG